MNALASISLITHGRIAMNVSSRQFLRTGIALALGTLTSLAATSALAADL